MPHVDPGILALRAVGEAAGASDDEQHLAHCRDCRDELGRLRAVVAVGRHDDQPPLLARPPDRVWASIVRELGPEAGLAGEPGKPAPVWWRRPLLAGAAGLLVGAALAAAGWALASGSSGSSTVGHSALRPLEQFPQWQAAAGTAVMQEKDGSRTVRVTLNAPDKPGFYEVWLLARNGTSMISLGDLNRGHTGSFTLPPGVDLGQYSRLDISLQPFDGSTQHAPGSVVRGPVP